MKPTWLWCSVLLMAIGCSLEEAQANRRVGLWDRHPEFRACIRQAVPNQVDYGEVYEACIRRDGEDTQAMECVRNQTPLEDLGQVKMCQRQLQDLVAYGDPNQSSDGEPSAAWAGPRIGFFVPVF
jgi:hypothetical protein